MKKLLAIAATCAIATAAFAQEKMTDEEYVQEYLYANGISYVWHYAPGGAHVIVFGDMDPAGVCQTAMAFPGANVHRASNITTEQNLVCAHPSK